MCLARVTWACSEFLFLLLSFSLTLSRGWSAWLTNVTGGVWRPMWAETWLNSRLKVVESGSTCLKRTWLTYRQSFLLIGMSVFLPKHVHGRYFKENRPLLLTVSLTLLSEVSSCGTCGASKTSMSTPYRMLVARRRASTGQMVSVRREPCCLVSLSLAIFGNDLTL